MRDRFRSGYVALTGRPNAGKSTLLNAVLGYKVAIATPRRQTTRNRIAGIKTTEHAQIVLVDTPGFHPAQHRLGEHLLKTAKDTLREADLVAFVVAAGSDPAEDRDALSALKTSGKPAILVVNKTDTVSDRVTDDTVAAYSAVFPFRSVCRISALCGSGISEFLDEAGRSLPEGPKLYPDDQETDQTERSIAAEMIREKVIANTSEEVPHAAAVEVTGWSEKKPGIVSISATIYVERDGQKGIIIGNKGARLKKIGSEARREIEALLQTKVFLELWVKVSRDWRNDRRMLREMGYH
ncbi:MAG: GTPase Era [Thermodesulfovibrionales bacterium]